MKGDWTCPDCGKPYVGIELPMRSHICRTKKPKPTIRPSVSLREEKPPKSKASIGCVHLGEPTGDAVPCNCPASEKVGVYRCGLGRLTTIVPVVKRNLTDLPEDRRPTISCLDCWTKESGYEKSPDRRPGLGEVFVDD